MTAASNRYLVEDQQRERQAARILLDLSPTAAQLFNPLGLNPGFSWFVLNLRKERLNSLAIGDVDILAGPLEWTNPSDFEDLLRRQTEEHGGRAHPSWIELMTALRLANAEGIKWPPSTAWLVAVEAKCAYLNPQAESISRASLKSTKASPRKVKHMREQIKGLFELGFNRVTLLDIVANPPVSGPDGQAWLTAAALAAKSTREFSQDLKQRLPSDSPAGHYVWSIGAVLGGHEGRRGSTSVEEMRAPRDNPLLSKDPKVKGRRLEVEANLNKIFERLPKPLNLRVQFSDCQSCGKIHGVGSECTQ